MKTQKMSLANMQGKLSRAEMKNIMAGSDGVSGFEDEFACVAKEGKCNAKLKCCAPYDCLGDCPATGATCG